MTKLLLSFLVLFFANISQADCIDEIVRYRSTGSGDLKTADCFHKSKLYSESLPLLTKLAEIDAESLEYLLNKLPKGYESIVENFLSKIQPKSLSKKTYGEFIYWRTQGLNRRGQYTAVLNLTKKFDPKHPRFPMIQFFKGVAYINANNIKAAENLFIQAKTEVQKKKAKTDKDLSFLDIVSSALGKLYLTEKKFTEAEKNYKDIRSDSAIWYDNLVELGWNQLSSKNYSQTLGNMYFVDQNTNPSAWKPDSYIIRSMAFLSLCHFSDADDALKVVEKYYKTLYEESLKVVNKDLNFYELLKESLQVNLQSYVSGVPVPLLRYAAIDIDFIQVQESINNLIDEIEAQKKLENKIAKRIRYYESSKFKNIDKVAKYKEQLIKLKAKKAKPQKIAQKEEALKAAEAELAAVNTGMSSLNKGIDFHISRLTQKAKDLEKLKLKAEASANRVLTNKIRGSIKGLKERLDQAELVRFEIYSRSGNNIRFRLAGGQISKKEKDTIFKAFGNKELKWDFKGEIWKDEYGSLDTSIKNMCEKR